MELQNKMIMEKKYRMSGLILNNTKARSAKKCLPSLHFRKIDLKAFVSWNRAEKLGKCVRKLQGHIDTTLKRPCLLLCRTGTCLFCPGDSSLQPPLWVYWASTASLCLSQLRSGTLSHTNSSLLSLCLLTSFPLPFKRQMDLPGQILVATPPSTGSTSVLPGGSLPYEGVQTLPQSENCTTWAPMLPSPPILPASENPSVHKPNSCSHPSYRDLPDSRHLPATWSWGHFPLSLCRFTLALKWMGLLLLFFSPFLSRSSSLNACLVLVAVFMVTFVALLS